MDSLHFNSYFADSRNATWTAYISTFTLQIPAMLHGQSTFHHLLCRFPPCYMESLHFNIYSAHSRHATWTAYISTFTLQIPTMLNGQPTFQHLLCRFPLRYMDSLQCNIYSADSHHATWTAFNATLQRKLPYVRFSQHTDLICPGFPKTVQVQWVCKDLCHHISQNLVYDAK